MILSPLRGLKKSNQNSRGGWHNSGLGAAQKIAVLDARQKFLKLLRDCIALPENYLMLQDILKITFLVAHENSNVSFDYFHKIKSNLNLNLTGIVNQNVLPWGLLSTPISPPQSVTSPLQIESPKPVPPVSRERA